MTATGPQSGQSGERRELPSQFSQCTILDCTAWSVWAIAIIFQLKKVEASLHNPMLIMRHEALTAVTSNQLWQGGLCLCRQAHARSHWLAHVLQLAAGKRTTSHILDRMPGLQRRCHWWEALQSVQRRALDGRMSAAAWELQVRAGSGIEHMPTMVPAAGQPAAMLHSWVLPSSINDIQ